MPEELLEGIDCVYTGDIATYDVTEDVKITAALAVRDIPEGVVVQDDVAAAEIELHIEEVKHKTENGGNE